MKIGIRAHDLGANNPQELAQLAEAYKFAFLQLVLKKSFNLDVLEISSEQITEITDSFREKNIQIAMLGSYFNPVHSNLAFRKNNIARFKRHLELAGKFGTPFVGTETGSYLDDPWDYHPKNHLDTSYQEVREIIRDLVNCAKTNNACVLIEGAYNHLIYEPELLKRLVDDIPSSNLRVTIDLYNYLNINNYQEHRNIFEKSLELLKDKISIVHLKDFIVADGKLEQVGLGQGLMDYPYLIKKIKTIIPEAVLIFEGISGEDISTSLNYLKTLEKSHE
ncbi:MAG: sugar phosphate isomerase/epimerase [Bacilli bacterium]|nr:sugar phosphate isomerase/epimerase [Bacilli bacterium]